MRVTAYMRGNNITEASVKIPVFIAILLFAGCECESIKACGYSCQQNGGRMSTYSQMNGCSCVYADAGP